MFEMTFGFSPFYNEDRLVIYENILSAPIKIATNRGSPESIDFLSQVSSLHVITSIILTECFPFD